MNFTCLVCNGKQSTERIKCSSVKPYMLNLYLFCCFSERNSIVKSSTGTTYNIMEICLLCVAILLVVTPECYTLFSFNNPLMQERVTVSILGMDNQGPGQISVRYQLKLVHCSGTNRVGIPLKHCLPWNS